jgi:endonuclease-3
MSVTRIRERSFASAQDDIHRMKKKETTLQLEKRRKRAILINSELKKLIPNAKMVLNYSNNWELLVAVVLSAQCTDKMVNKVTEKLFKKYPRFENYLAAKQDEFGQDIKSTGFYHNKAKNILAAAKLLHERYHDNVPNKMEDLLTIPGVARKTANIVLGNAYGIVEGIAVDTHVRRLSQKFGLTDEEDPVKIERDLMEILPKSEWFNFTYRMIEYGRNFSPASKQNSTDDPLSMLLL